MNVEQKLKALGIDLPKPAAPAHEYVPCRVCGNLLFSSGTGSRTDNGLLFPGKVGAEVTLEQAQLSARQAVANNLANIQNFLDPAAQIRILKLTGYVNSAPGFVQQPAVIDAASSLLVAVLGEAGRHARTAIGVAELPNNLSVEIEIIAEIIA